MDKQTVGQTIIQWQLILSIALKNKEYVLDLATDLRTWNNYPPRPIQLLFIYNSPSPFSHTI